MAPRIQECDFRKFVEWIPPGQRRYLTIDLRSTLGQNGYTKMQLASFGTHQMDGAEQTKTTEQTNPAEQTNQADAMPCVAIEYSLWRAGVCDFSEVQTFILPYDPNAVKRGDPINEVTRHIRETEGRMRRSDARWAATKLHRMLEVS